jgi:rare lipoprotein A
MTRRLSALLITTAIAAGAGQAAGETGAHVAGWTAVVAPEAVAARDPSWSFIVARIKQRSRPDVAELTPAGALPSLTGPTHALSGLASYYHEQQQTASGERFDRRQMTAAHRTLPFNSRVRVIDTRSGKAVVVRINDRGPYKPGRIIDLSEAAANALGIRTSGVTRVKLEVVSLGR